MLLKKMQSRFLLKLYPDSETGCIFSDAQLQ